MLKGIKITLYQKLRKHLKIDEGRKWERPQSLKSETQRYRTSCGKIYLTCARDNNGLAKEIYFQSGSQGCQGGQACAGRMVSLALRYNIPIEEVIEQLNQVKCGSSMKKLGLLENDQKTASHKKGEYVCSCAGAIVKILEKEIK